jgi:dienelactone hydrolase
MPFDGAGLILTFSPSGTQAREPHTMTSIRCLLLAAGIFTSALLPAVTKAAEPQKITFASADATATQITGHLYRPDGPGPFPAVVALHGCGGLLTKTGRPQKRDLDWAERLTAAGYAVLFPDSFNPRGVPQVCTLKQAERPVVPFDRAFDASAAADWLAAQPFIDKNRLALLGWSHGGSTVLWAARAGGAPKTAEFKTAIAFYPGCRVPLERETWKPRLQLKILIGSADDWTPPEPCRALAAKHNVPIVEYAGAYHGFDAPDVPVRVREGLGMTANGSGKAHVGTDPAARAAAIAEVMGMLREVLGK